MKTETGKLARIATVVCGSVAPFAAHAQQAEPVAQALTESAAVAAAPIAQPDQDSARKSANLPIVDATQSDAQCVTDAESVRGVPVSYAAPLAVPEHTDTVADMSTLIAAPVAAAAQANELEWDEPRGDAVQLANADVPPSVRPVPLENAARADGALDASRDVDVLPQRAPHAEAPLPPAKPARLPAVRQPVRKAPISYAAPVAVPVHTAQAVEANAAEAVSSPRDDITGSAMVAAAAESPRDLAQTGGQPADATPVRHISYAAPIVALTHGDAHAPADTRNALQPVAQAQPFMLTDVHSSDATPPAAQTLPLLPAPSAQQIDSHAASAPAALPSPKAKTPVSYAAPVAVPSRNDSSVTANRPALPARAATGNEDPNWAATGKVALSEERLDKMRGGFDLSSGLKVSFGISRMVVVNGNLLTTTSFNIPDISNISAQQAQALASVNAGALIQNGPGNIVQPGALPGLSGAVIQNTLNNQNIQALTTINTTVNSLSMFKNFNVGSTLNGALINAVRGR
jgi:hypothetical protein